MSDEDYSDEGVVEEDVKDETKNVAEKVQEPLYSEEHSEYTRGNRGYTRGYRQRGSHPRRRGRGQYRNYARDNEHRRHYDEAPGKSKNAIAIGCLIQ